MPQLHAFCAAYLVSVLVLSAVLKSMDRRGTDVPSVGLARFFTTPMAATFAVGLAAAVCIPTLGAHLVGLAACLGFFMIAAAHHLDRAFRQRPSACHCFGRWSDRAPGRLLIALSAVSAVVSFAALLSLPAAHVELPWWRQPSPAAAGASLAGLVVLATLSAGSRGRRPVGSIGPNLDGRS